MMLSLQVFEMAELNDLVCIADFEGKAKTILPKQALDYYASGSGREFTLNLNKTIFSRLVAFFIFISMDSRIFWRFHFHK